MAEKLTPIGTSLYVAIVAKKGVLNNEKNEYTPISTKDLINMSGIRSKTTVMKYMEELRVKGYISIKKQHAPYKNQYKIERELSGGIIKS